jgi:hypothetical protein
MRLPLAGLQERTVFNVLQAQGLLQHAQGLVEASKVARLERRMPDADAWTKELTAWILTRRGLL